MLASFTAVGEADKIVDQSVTLLWMTMILIMRYLLEQWPYLSYSTNGATQSEIVESSSKNSTTSRSLLSVLQRPASSSSDLYRKRTTQLAQYNKKAWSLAC